MKVMILGASGLLGKALMREWSGDEVVGLSSRDVDIRDADQVREVVEKSSSGVDCAGRGVHRCGWLRESSRSGVCGEPRRGGECGARRRSRAGAKLLFLSSDYVFDGKKTSPYETGDARNPQSVYGRSKAEAEVRLLEVLPECCIVRTSWLFGTGGKCFPDTILKLAASRPSLDVVNDQRGCPTYSVDLARAIIAVVPQGCERNCARDQRRRLFVV